MELWQNITQEKKLRVGHQPIIHRTKWANSFFLTMKSNPLMEGVFKCPDNLTIATINTYGEKSLFEKSLDYLGVGHVVLQEPFKGTWMMMLKLKFILNYLKSGSCKTDYFLYCDARDAILRDDPQEVVDIFESTGCDLLFGSTMYRGGFMCMPEVREWIKTVARKKGRYLNAGVFIGKPDFIQEVFEEAYKYDSKKSLTVEQYTKLGRGIRNTRLCKELPEYPKGSTDQDILRFLHPKFYPKMDIDYRNQISYRN